MRRMILAILFMAPFCGAVASNNINIAALNQGQFSDLSHDMTAVTSYKQLSAATSEGLLGFNLGFAYTLTNVAHSSAWDAASNSSLSSVSLAQVSISKGLPFDFDVGGYYGYSPNTNIKVYGVELRYAILNGGLVEPALGIRATYNWLTGVNQLTYSNHSLGLTLSKGFGPLTPYVGIGQVWVSSDPEASTGLQNESFNANQVFAGFRLSLAIMNLTMEADRTAGNNTYGVKLAFGF
ncbi:MAG: hypothetical protein KGL13_05230 [Gammaproteobacteria bacterium]|nr:hypothetical protein [Gammaproteobacteria bacterium]MDE2345851.1 hypothetical protein [Gammaproteobacteria bacterium]